MAICPSCGKDNQAHYKFCLGCGADLGESSGPSPSPDGARKGEPSKVGPSPKAPAAAKTVMADAPPAKAEPAHRESRDTREEPARPGTAPPVFADMGPPDDAGARKCPSCGSMVGGGFKFCPSCGASVAAASASSGPTGPSRQVAVSMAAPEGSLVLVRPDGTEGGTHPLVDGENPIGRGVAALFAADGYLSPVHAEMVLNAAGLVVRDTNSLNGVFVKITEEEEIYDGEVLRLGQELLRFEAIRPPEPLDDGTEILGSPNPGYWGRLAVIVGRDHDGAAYPLLGDAVILGRERGDITFPEDGYVSGMHARVSMRDGHFYLTDLNSSNGTFLRIRGERVVPSGSFVLMGQQLFRIAYH